MNVYLGFDTSCYTTSVAAVDETGRVIASCRQLLPVAQGQRGLRQSEGVFLHVKQLPALVAQLSEQIRGARVAAVCASAKPRDDEASYMPVFQVGDAQACSLASVLGVPFFQTTHQRGHLAAASVDSGLPAQDYLAVHLSGGTTEMLAYREDKLSLIGGTLDLHAGQLVDRIGVLMGLPFPSGPELEKLAKQGQATALLPAAMADHDLHCHLSGAETALGRLLAQGSVTREDGAAEVYDLLARAISRMLAAGEKETGLHHALIAGGVASSPLFRELLSQRLAKLKTKLHVYFGKPEYSGDNAVGAALLGLRQARLEQKG